MTGIRLSDDWSDNGWVAVPRNILRDSRLSLKAWGLVAYLASHQPGFRLTREFITGAVKDGRESVESGLRELRTLGYLTVEQARDDRGRLTQGSDYVLHRVTVTPETRTTESTVTPETRTPENPAAGESAAKRDQHIESPEGQETTTTAPGGASESPSVQASSEAEWQGRDGGGQAVNGHQAAQDQQAAGGSRPWGDPGLSVNQVATMLAQDHYDRLGRMGNVAAFVKIMRAGLRAGYTPAMINSAAEYIAAQNWTLTEERLANTLRGGPRRQAPPPPPPPRSVPRVTRPADAAPPSPPTWQGV